ncbi:MAG TPA: Rrf2 family transcriptional regulator [Bryobacteraceae bacterium]|nr:transcriptional regulator [Bryobacterales bacterium]HRJ17892.1 Rrf2 family transcriptional regulator [Bryobacteraceae bacterium]
MRQLSKRTQYSLRALYALSRCYETGPKLIGDLAGEEAIPKKFLEQILLSLKNHGLVASKKGRGGGYFLARSPEEITLGAVIRLVEGPLAPVPCASETSFRKCEECVDVETCGTRIVMREVRDAMAAILDRTTLAMVCRKVDERRIETEHAGALMYYI